MAAEKRDHVFPPRVLKLGVPNQIAQDVDDGGSQSGRCDDKRNFTAIDALTDFARPFVPFDLLRDQLFKFELLDRAVLVREHERFSEPQVGVAKVVFAPFLDDDRISAKPDVRIVICLGYGSFDQVEKRSWSRLLSHVGCPDER